MKRLVLAVLILLMAGPFSTAATIDAGDWMISQAAGQTVYVEVYTDVVETAQALNFNASLADGPGGSTALVFTALEFGVTDGIYGDYMWFGKNFNSDFSGPAATSASGGGFNIPPADVPIPGTPADPAGLVRVTLDASSAPLGKWNFLLSNSLGSTSLANPSAGAPQLQLVNGTITVTPEPTVCAQLLALLGMGGLGLFVHRRRQRAN